MSTRYFGLLGLLGLLISTGCVSEGFETTISGETEIAQLAINAWIDSDNPFPKQCYVEMGRVEIHFATPDEWTCSSSDPAVVDGCHERIGNSKDGTRRSRILIKHSLVGATANITLAHEYMHLLSHCAYGNHDKGHTRDLAWIGALDDVRTRLINDDLAFRRGETTSRIEL